MSHDENRYYQVISLGKLQESYTQETVKKNLIKIFKSNSKKIDILLKSQRVIKSGLDYETAVKYKTAIEKTGLLCEINKKEPPSQIIVTQEANTIPGKSTFSTYSMYFNLINKKYLLVFIAFLVILFLYTLTGTGLSNEDKALVKEAIASLEKINAATEIGVNYRNYNALIIEAKSKVNGISQISDENLKEKIKSTMSAYLDASVIWSIFMTSKYAIVMENTKEDKLIDKYYEAFEKKYKTLPGVNSRYYELNKVHKTVLLNGIWSKASEDFMEVKNLFHN